MKTRLSVLKGLSFLLPLLLFACAPLERPGGPMRSAGPILRVAILKGKQGVTVDGEGLSLRRDGRAVSHKGGGGALNYLSGGVSVAGEPPAAEVAVSGRKLTVNGRPYRGSLRVIAEGEGLTVINLLGIEEYLAGLINHEISSAWPLEAVKAQAVAARSYAWLRMKERGERPYHLESTVMDQVYGGSLREDDRARRAVEETAGQIVTYRGEPALAVYHSTCGGMTESAEAVWGKDYPYLIPVRDGYCTDAPHYFWSYEADSAELRSLLGMDNPGGAVEIVPLERSGSGRIRALRVAGREMAAIRFRETVGYDNIRSTLFNVEADGELILFTGSGSGHGVGMCQWGARGMASEGSGYRAILRHYYPGTRIERAF